MRAARRSRTARALAAAIRPRGAVFLIALLLLAASSPGVAAGRPATTRPLMFSDLGPELPRQHGATIPKAPAGASLDETVTFCTQQAMALHDTPGAAVAVAVDGDLAFQGGFGVRRRGGSQLVDAQTVFRIGSITKMMTAAGLMQLVETGAVRLDDPVTVYIPDFELAKPGQSATVTVEQLLTHTSDIPDTYAVGNIFHPLGLDEWVPHMATVELYAPAGSFWNYSNPNFSLAGLIIQRVTGLDYRSYMAERVWGPAGMGSTTFDGSAVEATGDYSWGHQRDASSGQETVYGPTSYASETLNPAGMAFSTAGDLVRWALLLMDGGSPVLAPASARRMQAPLVWTHTTADLWYGYGIFSEDFEGLDVRQHGGNVPGWGAYLLWVPGRRFAVAVLANTFEALDDAAYCIADGVLHPTGETPPPVHTNPSTWRRYRGDYGVAQYDGRTWLGTVGLQGDDLTLTATVPSIPPMTKVFHLEQLYLDTFVTDTDDDGKPDLDLTFIAPPGHPPLVRWMRNRLLVGTRLPEARRPSAGPARPGAHQTFTGGNAGRLH
ncbi:MAG: beta-lactamase family protein [Acidobacteria bacterium]|nr:beta-lactamase family protein [Acidobacteriota bacterium]